MEFQVNSVTNATSGSGGARRGGCIRRLIPLPFSCGGETYNHVICVRYKLLNEHLLVVTLAEGTWDP